MTNRIWSRAWRPGNDDYLSKPFDRQELHARLRTGGRILTLQDEQLKARHALHLQATQDGLTGTWNRTAILDLLHREYELAARTGSTIGVIMLDIDHFKQVNDTYGHLAGDHVLVEAARRMKEAVRSYDLIGRYGGEEFLVVSPDCDGERIQTCAERIRLAMAVQPVLAYGTEIAITVEVRHGRSGPPAEYRERCNRGRRHGVVPRKKWRPQPGRSR